MPKVYTKQTLNELMVDYFDGKGSGIFIIGHIDLASGMKETMEEAEEIMDLVRGYGEGQVYLVMRGGTNEDIIEEL